MSTPLWCLAGFVVWTLLLMFGIAAARVGAVLRGEKQANEFPAGVPHGGDMYWRLNRAHLNCTENLPLFGSVVLIAAAAGLHAPVLDAAAKLYLATRVGQSIAHVSSGSATAVNVRFTFFLVQVGCLVTFLAVMARGA